MLVVNILVSWKPDLEQGCLVLSDLDSEVKQTPSEVIDIDSPCGLLVDGEEDVEKASDAERGSGWDLCFHFFEEGFYLEPLIVGFVDTVIAGVWGCDQFPDVLVLLEFGRDVSGDLAFEF